MLLLFYLRQKIFHQLADSPLIPFLNQNWREGEPQTASIIRQGEADKISFDLEME